MTRKLMAEFFGTFWLAFGGCRALGAMVWRYLLMPGESTIGIGGEGAEA